MRSLKWPGLTRDVTGGCVGALTAVPIVLSCGAVLYETLGTAYVTAGIMAAFVGALIPALVAGCFGGAPLHVNTPKTTHAAILSGLAATVAASPAFPAAFEGADRATALMSVGFIALTISGLVQLMLGTLRLGNVVKFIPFPVLAGFVNGFAIQIVWRPLPRTIGLDSDEQLLAVLSEHAPMHLAPLGFAVLSACLVRQHYAAGDEIAAHIAAPGLLLLARGRAVSVVLHADETRHMASYRTGMALGEFRAQEHPPRRLKLVAQTDAVVLALPAPALEDLRATHAALVATLMTNLACELDRRYADLLEKLISREED